MDKKFISIILPIHNQADHVRGIMDRYVETLNRLPVEYELILVLNGCRDHSLTICKELAQQYQAVRLIETQRGGWGHAVRLGLKASRGEWICYTNSARTPANDLSIFILYAIANPDSVIKANRKIRDSLRRRIGSLLYNIECRTLFDLSNWEVNGTPKIFPRKFQNLINLNREDDLIDLEFNYRCKINAYPMLEIPILSTRRHGGKSTTGLKSAFKLYWGAFQMWRQTKKLKLYEENSQQPAPVAASGSLEKSV